MTYNVKLSHSDKSRAKMLYAPIRQGKVVYEHPEGRFITLEFEGRSGKFRESFRPDELISVV